MEKGIYWLLEPFQLLRMLMLLRHIGWKLPKLCLNNKHLGAKIVCSAYKHIAIFPF